MILETLDVVKRFGGLTAVDKVSLAVSEGEIFGLIGPNGAGKTTLLNVIAGVYKPDVGAVKFKGEEILKLSSDQICKKGISRTFQISQPFPKMSALENVMVSVIFGTDRAVKDPVAKAEEMLSLVEFPMPAETLASNLNAIQLKRLDLARALASHPKLLLLDELAAGLTTGELSELIALVRKIRDMGITIIIVEHVMRVIMDVCDRIAVLYYGQKIAEGTPKEIAENDKVAEAYLGEKYIL